MKRIYYLLFVSALLFGVSANSFGQCSGTPNGGTALSNSSVVSTSSSFTLSLNGASSGTGITYQWQSSACGSTWANISGATLPTLTTNQSASTMYRCMITCSSSGLSTPSAPVWVVRASAAFCFPDIYFGCDDGDMVKTFTLDGACGTRISSINMSCGATYTVDSTSTVIKMQAGSTYTGTISTGYYTGDNARVWIDNNNDGTFANGERVFSLNSIAEYPSSSPVSVVVPAAANVGKHRMRVAVYYNIAGNNGCAAPDYGSSIDYTVEIIPAAPTLSSNAPACPAATTLTASTAAACGSSYNWSGPSGSLGSTPSSNTYTAGLPPVPGIYSVTMTLNGATSCPATTNVTFLTTPTLSSLSSNTPVCVGGNLTFTANTPTNVTGYSWAGPVTVSGGPSATVSSVTAGAAGTYTLTVSASSGCTTKYTSDVAINAKPTISGITPSPTSLCTGNLLSFSAGTPTGVGTLSSYNWTGPNSFSINTPAGATSFSPSTSLASGLYSLTVTYPGSGCTSDPVVSASVAVNTTPTPITGGSTVICSGTTTSMTSTPVGGTWNTGSTDVATVSGTGTVSGISGGETLITYTAPGGCNAFRSVTVNPTPAYTITPSAPTTICLNETVAATLTTSPLMYALLTQNFNNGLGGWTIQVNSGPVGSHWSLVSSPAPLTSLDGDGTTMLQSNPLAFGSATNTSLTSPSFSTIGYSAATLYFNGYLLSDVSDNTVKVEYSTNGGSSWNDVINLKNTIMPNTTWSAGIPQYSVPLPAGAVGSGNVILRWNYIGQYTWAIDNISVKVQLPASTFSWSGPAGLSCSTCSSVNITPTATGSNVYNATVNGSAGCNANTSVTVSVNPLPTPISGNLIVCENATNILTSTPAGTWNSGDITKATIGSGTGALTGVLAGTANITYTANSGGCITTAVATVIAAPSAITPATAAVCLGNTLALGSLPLGGAWNSDNTAVAPVSASGIVSGASTGVAGITYTLPSGCTAIRNVSVNPLPVAISGAASICIDATTIFTNTDPLGTWTSDNSSIASVNATTGQVLGVAQGNTYITYTLPTGCYTVKLIQVNPLPLATTGTNNLCVGNTTVLFNSSGGGTWSSSAPAIASVNSSGIVTAGSFAGTADIYYTLTASGCRWAHNMVVSPLPQPISGLNNVCKDATVTFTDADPFGTWSSADATIATIDGSGLVTGVGIGNTVITYTLPTGCMISKGITVNALPNNISGAAAVCYGSTTNLLNTTPAGTWSTSDAAIATVNSIGRVTPVATVGGAVTITYMVTASGCYKTHDIQVNPLPDPINGTTILCNGETTNLTGAPASGTWSSSNTSVITIDATSGAGVAVGAGTANITYTLPTTCRITTGIQVNALPDDIFGTLEVCAGRQTTLGTTSSGGDWISSDPSIAAVNSSGDVTGGMVSTMSTANISYVFPSGCYKLVQVTVNPLPGNITGNFALCIGTASNLSSPDAGGSWTSSNSIIASVSVLGVVTGHSTGAATITYTLPTGCATTQAVVVNPLPASITGTASVCVGLTTNLSNSTPNGTWSSEDILIASVDPASGLVTGESNGTVNIIYTLPTGCSRSRAVTVNPTPGNIGGTLSACPGQTSQLNSNPSNGTWTSGSSSVASISSSGLVTANAAGTANITYTLPAGCRTVTTFLVNPLPGPISGSRVICQGGSSTLNNATPDGVWTSGDGLIAPIDGGTGQMTGSSAGVTSVTYTISLTGCARSANVTVNPLPMAITGTLAACVGSTTTLSTLSTGGTWSSNNPSVAAISSTGVVTGNTAGTADIAYTFATGCRTTTTVSINDLPVNITGATSVCLGQQATVLNTTGGGSWAIDNPSIANIDVNGVVTGMGVGVATVKYTIDLTGCYKTRSFTVNALPAAITGNTGICQSATTMLGNATANGTWSSSNTAVAPINSASGLATGLAVGFSIIQYTLPTGCSSTATLIVNALPDPITGTPTMCVAASTQLESNTLGGTWSSSSALASVNASGMVTGVASGTANISYTTGNGCRRIRTVSVNALPALITGTPTVCPGLTTTLGNSVAGGTWFSDDLAVATISSIGVVTPATTTGGTANILYTLPTGCSRSTQITVHPAVDDITGTGTVCKGNTTTLSNTLTTGVWSSSNTSVATVNTTGIVTGAGAGLADIAYTMPTGCKATKQVVVNPLPGNISGATAVCVGSAVTLGNTIPGGTYAGSDDTKALVSSTGTVTGVDAGTLTVIYALPTGCSITKNMVVNGLPAIKNVTGGGSYCAGGTGVAIGLDGSEPGVLYKLMNGGTTPLITMTGTGGTINFGDQTGAGTYMVTAVTPEGCMQNMNDDAEITINPLIAPSVTMVSDKGSSVCAGTSVTYTATGLDGGTTPTYTWMVNGLDMGATATHTYIPVHGDIVSVKFTSSEACAAPANITAQMVMTVRPNLTPAISINAEPGNKLCAGQTATFKATIDNGGIDPVYTWLVNGAIVPGATNSIYSYIPANNDLVLGKLNSSHSCLSVNNVPSNSITMEIAPVYVPAVEVKADPGTIVPQGTEVTYTAIVSNAGTSPQYQWFINMTEITDATGPVFKTSNLRNGDSVTCMVQGTGECSKASINSVVMEITPSTGITTRVIGNSEIRLVPNPNNGTFTVSGTLATKTDEAVMFEVTDMLGQVVYKGSTTAKAGVVEAKINLGNTLANGMYMLNMAIGTERKAFHFVMKQ